MRWVGVGACSVVVFVVGCRGNPWFILADDGATGMGSTAAASGETTVSEVSEGDTSSSGVVGSSTTSTGSGPDTGDVSDSEAADTGTDADTTDTTTGARDTDSSSGTSDGTTGDVEEEIYDLHERCDDVTQTKWVSELGGAAVSLECDVSEDPKSPPWVGYLSKLMVGDQLETTVIAAVPLQKVGAQLTGEFNGLQLADAVEPHLRAVLVCPAGDKPCSIIGSVIVEMPDNEFVTGELEVPVGPGQMHAIDIDLTPELAQLASQEFRVVLAVTAQNGDGDDRGVWVRPRIVDLK